MAVMSDSEVAMDLMVLIPTDTTIPRDMSTRKSHKPPLALIATMRLEVPLLTPPLLPPTEFYALVKTIATSLTLTEEVRTLLAWMRRGIMDSVPYLNILGDLEPEDKVTGNRKKMWRELVPASQQVTPQAPNYNMQTAQVQVQAPHTPKKETLPE